MGRFVLLVIGIVLGAVVFESAFPRWLMGAMGGWIAGQFILLRRRLARLERRIEDLGEVATGKGVEGVPAYAGATVATPEADFIFEPEPIPAAARVETAGPDHPRRQAAPGEIRDFRRPQEPAPSAWGWLPEWITGGNLLVKIGVVILFFGVAFLLKFASEYGLLPIELRLAAVAGGALALLAVGWRLREKRLRYALALQGGGVGILYLTIFASLRLYQLLPAGFAFAVLVLICALSAVLAVLQDSRALAVLGASGGFLAPVLASTGSGSHVALFSYYALLNAGIIGIAWFRSWRLLNLVGFLFTFVIGALWGARYYRPAYFNTTEPFLLLFVAVFAAVAILFARRQPPQLRGYVDGTLVFGTPIIGFALQTQLVAHAQGLAWSAVGFGLFYLACAWLVYAWLDREGRLLCEAFLAFGVIFATLAIPLALDGRWTAATWAAEGAALVWVGVRQARLPARTFGTLLLVGAGLFFLRDLSRPVGSLPVLNGFFLGCTLIAGSALVASWHLHRHREAIRDWERPLGVLLFVWGMLWWFGGGGMEIKRQVPASFLQGGLLLFAAFSAALCSLLQRRLAWPLLSWAALALLPLAAALFLSGCGRLPHPLAQGGAVGWPVTLLLLYLILHRQEHVGGELLRPLHAAVLWLATAVLTVESAWCIDRLVDGAGVWPLIAWGVVPALVLLLLSAWGERLEWPVRRHHRTYLVLGLGPVALAAWGWGLFANFTSSGEPWPLPYLPLLNPLDIGIAFVALGLWAWQAHLCREEFLPERGRRHFLALFACSLFLWGNGVLVRTVHHWGGVPLRFDLLWRSVLLQTSFSLAWTLLALCVMVVATRRRLRFVWMTGATLLAVVVGKLFLVDLSGTGTIERIISFVGVGLLLLLIGWFSPAPPRGEGRSS
ncbi:MAG: DUF2339 domain-containing protein [Desulfuromonadales bacterium]